MATIKKPPALYKAYFDDPSLSDLTIKLSDRSVHLHRVVLCRGSEYFANLLDGRFQESNSKEVELREDDPEAMMAVLRHLYGLPYAADQDEWHDGATLLPHVLVYITAEKYQITDLKGKLCAVMSAILCSYCQNNRMDAWLGSPDHLNAVREMIAGTTSDDIEGRNLLIDWCADRMDRLHKNESFMQLVAEVPELGADLIAHFYDKKDRYDSDADYDPDTDADEEYCEECDAMTTFVCSQCVE